MGGEVDGVDLLRAVKVAKVEFPFTSTPLPPPFFAVSPSQCRSPRRPHHGREGAPQGPLPEESARGNASAPPTRQPLPLPPPPPPLPPPPLLPLVPTTVAVELSGCWGRVMVVDCSGPSELVLYWNENERARMQQRYGVLLAKEAKGEGTRSVV